MFLHIISQEPCPVAGAYLLGAQYILMEGRKSLGGLLKVIKTVTED